MKKSTVLTVILILGLILIVPAAYANNPIAQNVQYYTSPSQPAGTIDIKFDLAWSNRVSGTDANTQAYFDRAWVFVKFWDTTQMGVMGSSNYPWGHCILTTGGSLSTYSSTTNTGITTDGIGAFVSPGIGQTVRWNYAGTLIPGTSNHPASTDNIQVRVCVIEMCYVPTGSFWVGDGTTNTVEGQFEQAGTTTPFNITSEAAITLGPGGLGDRSGAGMSPADDFTDAAAPTLSPTNLPDNSSGTGFPKGYHAFYLMKYDITEGQYVGFLNTLTRKQQINRVGAGISTATPPTNIYVMSNAATITYRNTITFSTPAPTDTTTPYTFTTTRPYRTCNYLEWQDVCAYAAWAGLRPMTELEYEKACRGGSPTNNTVVDEAAWGQSITNGAINIVAATTISGTEDGTETITNAGANCNINGGIFTGGDGGQGALRAGIFAHSSGTTRASSGSSYYGIMELSGNLWERPVTVGNSTGRKFTGSHGNGTLTLNTTSNTYDGDANNTDWPGYVTNQGVYNQATGSGHRGGRWSSGWTIARASDRYYAALTYTTRFSYNGGRCARTSP